MKRLQKGKTLKLSDVPIILVLLFSFFRALLGTFMGEMSTLVLLVGILGSIIIWTLYTKMRFHLNRYMLPWILFGIYVILRSGRYSSSIYSYTTLVVSGMILFSACMYGIGSPESIYRIIKLFTRIHIIASLVMGVFPVICKTLIVPLFSINTQQIVLNQLRNGYVTGLTNHYSTNGIYLAIGLLASGSDYLFGNRKQRKENSVWFVLSVITLLMSGKRAHLVFSVFIVFLMFFLGSKERIESKIVKGGFILISAFTLVMIVANIVPSINVTLSRIALLRDSDDITNGRAFFYSYAINWFKEKPVFGIGWEGFKYELNSVHGSYLNQFVFMNAHNVYLQVLCELGILGFLFFMIAILNDLNGSIRIFRTQYLDAVHARNESSFVCSIFLFFVLYCITGNPLYDAEFFVTLMCVVVMYSSHLKTISQRGRLL